MKNLTILIFGTMFAAMILVISVPDVAAQDAVTTDAKHYTVEFENDNVRVLRVRYGPKEKSVMHSHPDSVAVSLSNMQGKFTGADGKSENRSFKMGEVRWSPAETHMPENLGDKPFEVILVELKNGAAGMMPAAADDAAKVSAKNHKVEFENDRVRVIRSKIGPHEKTGMHAHPNNVVVYLTDANVRSTSADGKATEVHGKAGQAVWRDALKHDAENLSDKPLEVIVVELKGK